MVGDLALKPPISFLLDLILDFELPPEAQKACRKYIRELERTTSAHPPIARAKPLAAAMAQAPSTLALMEKHAAFPPTAQIQTAAPITAPTSARIVGGEVGTGNGTKGPRKW